MVCKEKRKRRREISVWEGRVGEGIVGEGRVGEGGRRKGACTQSMHVSMCVTMVTQYIPSSVSSVTAVESPPSETADSPPSAALRSPPSGAAVSEDSEPDNDFFFPSYKI